MEKTTIFVNQHSALMEQNRGARNNVQDGKADNRKIVSIMMGMQEQNGGKSGNKGGGGVQHLKYINLRKLWRNKA